MNVETHKILPKKTLLDRARETMRLKHLAYRTEKSYCEWIKRFIIHNKMRHPKDLGSREVREYLTWLAVEEKVSAKISLSRSAHRDYPPTSH